VVLGVRDTRRGETVAREIRAELALDPDSPRVRVGPAPLDLASSASVRAFAAAFERQHPTLDVLVNNAGVNFIPESYALPDDEDDAPDDAPDAPDAPAPGSSARAPPIGLVAQINFLGPAALTRCLERPLLRAAERSRERVAAVAHVSSVTHRYASVASVHRFLRDWTEGSYANTKLANAQFARECQRRWGPEGVASSAVDPGAVYSSLWNNDAVFGSFPINRLLSFLYAPPTDAVESVVAAVVEPFAEARERERTKAGGFANAANDRRGGDDVGFRFYARGLFASDAVAFGGPGDARDATSRFARARWVARFALWGVATLACSLADWPLRRFTRGAVAGKVAEVPASEATYDEAIAEALWNEAAKAARAAGETTR
jgi:NAD(P)-dependent dehydrogenase (short-subunit alcohol dehydrogenase family)